MILYRHFRHFKRKGHTPADILVQPMEKITYDANSTSRFKIIKAIFLKCEISMSFLCKNFANEKLDLMELRKMEIVNAKVVFKS